MTKSDNILAGERTQEEWHAFKPAESNGYVYVQSDAGEEICTCYSANADANAGRIAALPELVEVVRAFLAINDPRQYEALIPFAKTVFAKAGERLP